MFCYHCSMAHNRKRRRQSAYSSEGYLPQTRSYQTRIAGYEGIDRAVGDAALSAYAALYGKVQHKLFAVVAAGGSAVSKKSEYIEEHGIPGRLFNAARITLDGKVSAVRESQLLQLDSLRRRVSRAERQVAGCGTGPVAAGAREAAAVGQPEVPTCRCWQPTLWPAGCGSASVLVAEAVSPGGPMAMRAMRNVTGMAGGPQYGTDTADTFAPRSHPLPGTPVCNPNAAIEPLAVVPSLNNARTRTSGPAGRKSVNGGPSCSLAAASVRTGDNAFQLRTSRKCTSHRL